MSVNAPYHWIWETGDGLRPAVERYLRHEPLSIKDIALIRAYLLQWVRAPVWYSADAQMVELRTAVEDIKTRGDIERSIAMAVILGMDPL
jgi:hypothetical protein